jgi:hypothetical protein
VLLSSTLTSVEVVIVVVSRRTIAIVVVACRVVALVDSDTFILEVSVCALFAR